MSRTKDTAGGNQQGTVQLLQVLTLFEQIEVENEDFNPIHKQLCGHNATL